MNKAGVAELDLEAIRRWNESGGILGGDVTALIAEVERLRNQVELLRTALDTSNSVIASSREAAA